MGFPSDWGLASFAMGSAGAMPSGTYPSIFSSAFSVKTAIGWLTLAGFPSSTRILRRYPGSKALNSMVALSVATSTRSSPDATLSPTFLCHLAMLPSSIVGESFGIVTVKGIKIPCMIPLQLYAIREFSVSLFLAHHVTGRCCRDGHYWVIDFLLDRRIFNKPAQSFYETLGFKKL